MVLSGCLAPSVPVDEIELDECKKKDAYSCVNIAKQIQTQYDTIEKSGDEKAKKKLGSIQKDILKYYDLACEYGDFDTCSALASMHSSKALELDKSDEKQAAKEAKAAYIYMRKVCDVDSAKCLLDPKNFFAKNDEKLANIVWLALKDEKPEKLLNLNKSVKYMNDVDDTIYHLAQACFINKDKDCKSLAKKVGDIELKPNKDSKYAHRVMFARKCEIDSYSAEACVFEYVSRGYWLSLILAKDASGILLSKDELVEFVKATPYFKSVLDRHYPNKDNNGGSYFKPNADNTCLDIGETDYLLYYDGNSHRLRNEEKKELSRLRTQFKDDYVKEMEKLHPNKFSDGYIDCSVNTIKMLSKTRVSSGKFDINRIFAGAIKERFDTLLDKCIDKNDKKSCELIVSDYNKIKVISYEEASDVYTVREGMEYFINTYYKAMQGKSIDASSSPYGDTKKKIANATAKKFPNQLKFPDAKKYGGLFLDTEYSASIIWWNYNYNEDKVSGLYKIASDWGGVDFANQKLMELLNNDINAVVDEFKKAMLSDGTIGDRVKKIKGIMYEVGSDYDLFGIYNNEKFEALKSEVAYDVMFYYLAPETIDIIKKKFSDGDVKKAFLSLIEKQVQISKEKIIKYIEKQRSIEEAKRIKKEKEWERKIAKQEKERKEAIERCKRSPQCMAQLRAKAQELRKQSRKYYMMATNARTNKEYKEYKEQADIACGRAIQIEETGEDPGYFGGMFIGAFLGVEHCL